jgi:hypothetical protein
MDGRKFLVDKALPTAFSSVFGWILIGSVSDQEAYPYQLVPVAMTVSIEGLIERFWQVEEPEAGPRRSRTRGVVKNYFVNSLYVCRAAVFRYRCLFVRRRQLILLSGPANSRCDVLTHLNVNWLRALN